MLRRVTSDFELAPDSLHAARTFVRVILSTWGVGELTERAALVTSELATDALLRTQAGYRVSVEWDQPDVRIEILERPSEEPLRIDPPRLAEDGRGRQVVENLASGWGTRFHGPRRALWCSFAGSGPARPAGR